MIFGCILENQPKFHTKLSLLYFIGPANSYTHTLPMHIGITRLNQVFYFSITSFADHGKSKLRQWGPWKVLYEKYGYEIGPSVSEMSKAY